MIPRRCAFSLVELLVSVAVLALMLVLLSGSLGHVMRLWSEGNQRAEISQTSRAVVEMIGRELLLAEALPAGMQGNFKAFASSPFVVNPPLGSFSDMLKDEKGTPMDSLFFYSPLKTTPLGPLVLIGYFTTADHELRRLAVPSDNTAYIFLAAANLPVYHMWNPSGLGIYFGRNSKLNDFLLPAGWLNPRYGKGFATAAGDGNVTSTVAERVLGFFVRPIGRDGNPLPSSQLPSTAPSSTAATPLARAYNSAWWPVADTLPSQIEITLVVCGANDFRRLKAQNNLPLLMLPASNSDSEFQAMLADLQRRLEERAGQFAIVTRRFTILRGAR